MVTEPALRTKSQQKRYREGNNNNSRGYPNETLKSLILPISQMEKWRHGELTHLRPPNKQSLKLGLDPGSVTQSQRCFPPLPGAVVGLAATRVTLLCVFVSMNRRINCIVIKKNVSSSSSRPVLSNRIIM